jgi:hypothetical protein
VAAELLEAQALLGSVGALNSARLLQLSCRVRQELELSAGLYTWAAAGPAALPASVLLQQLPTGLVGLLQQGPHALPIPAEVGPIGLLPDPGRLHPFRLIASSGEAIRGWFSLQPDRCL